MLITKKFCKALIGTPGMLFKMDSKWGRYRAATREGSKAILFNFLKQTITHLFLCVGRLLLALKEHLQPSSLRVKWHKNRSIWLMIEKNIWKYSMIGKFDNEWFYPTCFSWLSKEIKPFLLRFAGELLTAFQGLYLGV
jgi:hypothetical protein